MGYVFVLCLCLFFGWPVLYFFAAELFDHVKGLIAGEPKAREQRRRQERERRLRDAAATPATPTSEASATPRREEKYGDAHKALRAAWKDIIMMRGADCMERDCLMPSRAIPAGAAWDAWDLAHDHQSAELHSYLGPAHKVCNQAEALRRGVTWPGAPSLTDLLAAVARTSKENTCEDPWGRPDHPDESYRAPF